MGDETVDAVARSQIGGLIAKVDSHRAESQMAHCATATALTSQSIVLARVEERQAAEAVARKLAEEKAEAAALSPAKIAAIAGGIGTLLTVLGYGAPAAVELAQGARTIPAAHVEHVPEASP